MRAEVPTTGLRLVLSGAKAASLAGSTSPPSNVCQQCLTLNFFFDGTGNNLDADIGTQQQSNVARLFQSRLDDDDAVGRRSFYIPGLGTYFKDIGDPGHTARGRGMGHMGQDRLDWAFKKFDEVIRKAEARAQNPTNKILSIKVSVFGFSRGATAARAFVRDMATRCIVKNGRHLLKQGGYPIEVTFLGIFDTVASVGVPMSANNTGLARTAGQQGNRFAMSTRSMNNLGAQHLAFGEPGADPAPGDFDGHASWADGLEVPTLVKQCVHMVAGHEIRNSFPVDSVLDGRGYPDGTAEMVYPGAHSDVGGGYQPGEGARSPHYGEMLSLIPLRVMHQRARDAGVPLLDLAALKQRSATLQRAFALDEQGASKFKEMERLWRHYMNTAGSGGKPVGQELLRHLAWYLKWKFFKIRRDEAAKKAGRPGAEAATISAREPGFKAERDRRAKSVSDLEQEWKSAQSELERAEARRNSAQIVQARTGYPVPPDVKARVTEAAAVEDSARDRYLRAKAQLDTYADDSELSTNLSDYDWQLVEDAKQVARRLKDNPRLKLRPHYRNLLEAYEAHYVRRQPLDGDIVKFFDSYVHDSLAGFATDATLPSDPRVIYAGGDNKIRFAATQPRGGDSSSKAA